MKRFDFKTVALLTLPVLVLSGLALWPKDQSSELRLSIEKNEFTKYGTYRLEGHNRSGLSWSFGNGSGILIGDSDLKTCEPKPSQCVDKSSIRTFHPIKDKSLTMINRGVGGQFSREDIYDLSVLKKQKGPLVFEMEVSCSTVQGTKTQSQWVTLEIDPKTIKSK